jgi:hypothetical protein
MAKGGGGIGSSRGGGSRNGKSEGGGEKKTKSKKKVISVATWNKLSNRERENVFGGVRPGSVKKKVLTAKQKRDAMRGDDK